MLDDFGRAVKRARSLKGWTLDQLAGAMDGSTGKSFLSNIEKGQRDISPRTVGRLINALDLDETWIDPFLAADIAPDAEETRTDRDADRLPRSAAKDETIPETARELTILLANTYAEGKHVDVFTAYTGLRSALDAAAAIKARGEMPDNTGGQLQAVMAEVARPNDLGQLDAAAAVLDDAMARVDQNRAAIFDQQLNQDRLRNRPEEAAERLIRNLHRRAPAGGVFNATCDLLHEWRERGERQGSPFDVQVALALAKWN
ncbi:MAG: helix-turn-helix domain-containing protein [Paracoccaceae bacterium]|nr:helix-turn-helix domain-containing protein [Paracoccaceae bacterium]